MNSYINPDTKAMKEYCLILLVNDFIIVSIGGHYIDMNDIIFYVYYSFLFRTGASLVLRTQGTFFHILVKHTENSLKRNNQVSTIQCYRIVSLIPDYSFLALYHSNYNSSINKKVHS